MKTFSISVLGAGSWGTALAAHLARNQISTCLWARNAEHVEQMRSTKMNAAYLPGVSLPDNLHYSYDLEASVLNAHIILICTPSHSFADMLKQVMQIKPDLAGIVWATKGLDPTSGCFLHEVVEQVCGPHFPMVLLTGPSFAKEVVKGLPTAVTLAHNQHTDFASDIQKLFHSPYFRAYTTSDLIGAEVGGAVKNVLAIATGIAEGLGFGVNAKAGLMTRGMAEMMRLGCAVGAKSETLMGLSGLGDLILTCSDNQSRNRRFGLALGQGQSIGEAVASIGQVVEGIPTTESILNLARKLGVDMPITEQMYQVLFNHLPAQQAVKNLLERDSKAE